MRAGGGAIAAKPMGGKRPPLDARKDFLLALVATEPDLTLQEIRGRLRQHGVIVAASSVWRFCDPHGLSFKKSLHAAEQDRDDVGTARNPRPRRDRHERDPITLNRIAL